MRFGDEDEDESLWVDIEALDEFELRILAEKLYQMLERDLLIERERKGVRETWTGWRQA